MPIVSVGDLSTLFGIVPRSVQRLAKDEGMPQEGHGKYDLYRCAAWYIRYLQKAIERRSTSDGGDGLVSWSVERARAMRAEADLKEIEVARARSELIPVDEAAHVWDETFSRVRARLIASISSGAVRAVGLKTIPEASALLEEIIHTALADIVALGREIDSRDSEDGSGTTPAP